MDGCRFAPLDGTSVIHNASPLLHSTEMYAFVKLFLCNITFTENIDLYNMTIQTFCVLYLCMWVQCFILFIYAMYFFIFISLFLYWPDITQWFCSKYTYIQIFAFANVLEYSGPQKSLVQCIYDLLKCHAFDYKLLGQACSTKD